MQIAFALVALLPFLTVALGAPLEAEGLAEGGFLKRRFNYEPDLPVGKFVQKGINPDSRPRREIIAPDTQVKRKEDDGLQIQVKRKEDDGLQIQVKRKEDDGLQIQVKRKEDVDADADALPISNQLSPRSEDGDLLVQVKRKEDGGVQVQVQPASS